MEISPSLKGFLDLVMGITLHSDGSYADRVQKQVNAAKRNKAAADWFLPPLAGAWRNTSS